MCILAETTASTISTQLQSYVSSQNDEENGVETKNHKNNSTNDDFMTGILGHSVGEIACGYADGSLTVKEAMQIAYWRGRSGNSAVRSRYGTRCHPRPARGDRLVRE